MTKDQLVQLIRKIMNAEYASEEERDQWITLVERNVPHSQVSNLIFYPEREMTAEEVVDVALGYQPLQLPSSLNSDDHG